MSTFRGPQCFNVALKCNVWDYEEVEQFLFYSMCQQTLKAVVKLSLLFSINYLLPQALLSSLQFKWSQRLDSRWSSFFGGASNSTQRFWKVWGINLTRVLQQFFKGVAPLQSCLWWDAGEKKKNQRCSQLFLNDAAKMFRILMRCQEVMFL